MSDVFVDSFVKKLVDDGHGELVDDHTVKSLNDDTIVHFESVNDPGEENTGLRIFTDNVLTVDVDYSDEDFSKIVMLSVLSDLKAL